MENTAAPGERVFTHTHQGYARTRPGHADWLGLYTDFRRLLETHEPALLSTGERVADYGLQICRAILCLVRL